MEEWIHTLNLAYPDEVCMALRLIVATVLGGGMGFERMRKMRAAGLRTYILVSVGSAMAMITGWFIAQKTGNTDPARIAAQVISGIGFIGAGTIMMTGYHRVRGLTTAAGLWATASMGIAVGTGYYFGGICMFVIMMTAMLVGERIQNKFLSRNNRLRVYVLFEDAMNLREFLMFLRDKEIVINDFEQLNAIGCCVGTTFNLIFHTQQKHAEMMQMITSYPGVAFAEEI